MYSLLGFLPLSAKSFWRAISQSAASMIAALAHFDHDTEPLALFWASISALVNRIVFVMLLTFSGALAALRLPVLPWELMGVRL